VGEAVQANAQRQQPLDVGGTKASA
jgi:hypothetical protein